MTGKTPQPSHDRQTQNSAGLIRGNPHGLTARLRASEDITRFGVIFHEATTPKPGIRRPPAPVPHRPASAGSLARRAGRRRDRARASGGALRILGLSESRDADGWLTVGGGIIRVTTSLILEWCGPFLPARGDTQPEQDLVVLVGPVTGVAIGAEPVRRYPFDEIDPHLDALLEAAGAPGPTHPVWHAVPPSTRRAIAGAMMFAMQLAPTSAPIAA